jgi:hypothetical protein
MGLHRERHTYNINQKVVAMRAVLVMVVMILAAGTADAQGQAPRPLPARIDAVVGLPGTGPAQWANVNIDFSNAAWALEGCVSSAPGSCRATARIVLTQSQRQELVVLLQDVLTPRRCEPEGFVPGDPEYSITTPSETWSGHLPRDSAQVATRTQGPCAATTRLAWWFVQAFGAPGVTASQSGGGP